MGKKKTFEIKIPIYDNKLHSHIVGAYGLACRYRARQGNPVDSLENWLLKVVFEGCSAMYKFDADMQKNAAEQVVQEDTASDK